MFSSRPRHLLLTVLSGTLACINPDVVATKTAASAPGEVACEAGSTSTAWATQCATSPPTTCTQGTWTAAGSSNADDTLVTQSLHFAVYSNGAISLAQAQAITDELENAVWPVFIGSPVFFPEPYCGSATKYKTSVMVRDTNGVMGGSWGAGYLGIWVAVTEHWGLAFSFVQALLSQHHGLTCGSDTSDTCSWIFTSYANFMVHQLAEFRDDMHCSEMLFNMPHLYLGSTRDRYCNWQFLEYLKDRYCFEAVNAIWTNPTPVSDPFLGIVATRRWSLNELNDFLGEWAMHNIAWDYRDSAPAVPSPVDPATAFRAAYGPITDVSNAAHPERRLRLTALDPLGHDFATTRRFYAPYFWAPQRWGYNVVQLFPDSGATSVKVTFRGVEQSGARSDWRWGLVATNPGLTAARYSPLQSGSDGELTFCVGADERVWLVVMATPSERQTIYWDQPYATIFRYPYMVELSSAWPRGFEHGALAPCAPGLTRHMVNGGGCAPPDLPSSVYVAPYAQVLGGLVTGSARIEDHAAVFSGTVSGGTVGALSTLDGFTVSGAAKALTSFYPLGFFDDGQSISGTALLYGDVEYRGDHLGLSTGAYSGLVDSTSVSQNIVDVNIAPPYSWRP